MKLYKIVRAAEWAALTSGAAWDGSADDRRDGFIHLSGAEQVAGTAARHFGGETGLIIAAFDADALGPGVQWEESSSGQTFPHLYAPLPLAAMTGHWPLAEWLALPPSDR